MIDLVPPLDTGTGHVVVGPDHLHRSEAAPEVRLRSEGPPPERVVMHVAHGGGEDVRSIDLLPAEGGATGGCFAVPDDEWRRLVGNQGYWWVVSVAGADGRLRRLSSEARCLVRHRDLPRVKGSSLRYRDDVGAGDLDLGVRVAIRPTRRSRVARLADRARGGRVAALVVAPAAGSAR